MTIHDLTLLLGLRRRHAWTELVFWGYAAGMDLDSDRHGLDRLYLVYLIVLLGAWAVASAAVVTTMVSEFFAGLAAADVLLFVRLIWFGLLVGAVAASIAALRSSPLKLSAPDIAYLAASPIASTALWGLEAALRTAGAGLFGFAGGYLLGIGLEAAGLGTVPLPAAVMTSLTAMVVVLNGWVVGAARLSRPARSGHGSWALVWPSIGVWLAAGGLWATVLAGSFAAMWLALTGSDIAAALCHARALGQVLPDQPVRVLVGAALPGVVRGGEAELDARGILDELVAVELRAVVSRDRQEPSGLTFDDLSGVSRPPACMTNLPRSAEVAGPTRSPRARASMGMPRAKSGRSRRRMMRLTRTSSPA